MRRDRQRTVNDFEEVVMGGGKNSYQERKRYTVK